MSTQQPEPKQVPWRPIVALVVLVAALVLILQNAQQQRVDVFWMTVTMPLWILLATTFLLGGVAGWMVKARRARRRT